MVCYPPKPPSWLARLEPWRRSFLNSQVSSSSLLMSRNITLGLLIMCADASLISFSNFLKGFLWLFFLQHYLWIQIFLLLAFQAVRVFSLVLMNLLHPCLFPNFGENRCSSYRADDVGCSLLKMPLPDRGSSLQCLICWKFILCSDFSQTIFMSIEMIMQVFGVVC